MRNFLRLAPELWVTLSVSTPLVGWQEGHPKCIETTPLISPHDIAMPRAYIFFRRLISEVTKRISTKLGYIFTWLLFEKFGQNSYGHLSLTGWGQKPLLGTDFELWPNIWPNISLQRNMISTIEKKLVNLQGLPYMTSTCPATLVTLAQKRLKMVGEFLPTP